MDTDENQIGGACRTVGLKWTRQLTQDGAHGVTRPTFVKSVFIPDSEIERGAHPPRVRFSAPSRKTWAHRNYSKRSWQPTRKVLVARRGQQRPGRACSPSSEFGFICVHPWLI